MARISQPDPRVQRCWGSSSGKRQEDIRSLRFSEPEPKFWSTITRLRTPGPSNENASTTCPTALRCISSQPEYCASTPVLRYPARTP
eukprot:3704510-Rhodomonas_salina.2